MRVGLSRVSTLYMEILSITVVHIVDNRYAFHVAL